MSTCICSNLFKNEEPDEHISSSRLSPSDGQHVVKDDLVSHDETFPRERGSPIREKETQDEDMFTKSLEQERRDQVSS